jgi:hypothetical protein
MKRVWIIVIAVLIMILAYFIYQINSNKAIPKDNDSKQNCAVYEKNNEKIEYCSTCGNNLCEEIEHCTPSIMNCKNNSNNDSPICLGTADCGPLYCSKDCKETPQYECPNTQIIDCMPVVPAEDRAYCYGEYHDWIVKNCNITFAL